MARQDSNGHGVRPSRKHVHRRRRSGPPRELMRQLPTAAACMKKSFGWFKPRRRAFLQNARAPRSSGATIASCLKV